MKVFYEEGPANHFRPRRRWDEGNDIVLSVRSGGNATEEMKENLQIVYDELLPKWNYVANPQN